MTSDSNDQVTELVTLDTVVTVEKNSNIYKSDRDNENTKPTAVALTFAGAIATVLCLALYFLIK